jgi:hypothetical protein
LNIPSTTTRLGIWLVSATYLIWWLSTDLFYNMDYEDIITVNVCVWSHSCTSKLFLHILNLLKLRVARTTSVATHIQGLFLVYYRSLGPWLWLLWCCGCVCVLWGYRCGSLLHSCIPPSLWMVWFVCCTPFHSEGVVVVVVCVCVVVW